MFLPFLVSLHWCEDHDGNELVNKLRFHNASNINQNGKLPCKMEGWSSNMLQISFAYSCKYHAPCNMKGLSSKCCRCHAKLEVLCAQCRLTLQNAENMANTTPTQTLLFVFLLFGLDNFASFLSSWFCKALRAFWLHQQQPQQQQ